MRPSAVIIGVGDPHRRDNGVGPAVVDRIRQRHLPAVTLAESDGNAAALIALWDRAGLAIVIDAVRADPAHPGRVHRMVVPHPGSEHARAAGGHGMDLGRAVELARDSHRLPGRLVLFGVEVADTRSGYGLTDAVRAAAGRVADEIEAEGRHAT